MDPRVKNVLELERPGIYHLLYRNVSREGKHRAGVVMHVKSKTMDSVIQIDIDEEDPIWVVLLYVPTLKLGEVYIPPNDSPYYSTVQYGTVPSLDTWLIQAK